MITLRIAALAALLSLAAGGTHADGPPATVQLQLKDHRFTPSRITVSAAQRVRIELVNLDAASEEFDSSDLGVERDVTPHGKVIIEVGPLKPGTYSFMGELHADTAQGELIAEAVSR